MSNLDGLAPSGDPAVADVLACTAHALREARRRGQALLSAATSPTAATVLDGAPGVAPPPLRRRGNGTTAQLEEEEEEEEERRRQRRREPQPQGGRDVAGGAGRAAAGGAAAPAPAPAVVSAYLQLRSGAEFALRCLAFHVQQQQQQRRAFPGGGGGGGGGAAQGGVGAVGWAAAGWGGEAVKEVVGLLAVSHDQRWAGTAVLNGVVQVRLTHSLGVCACWICICLATSAGPNPATERIRW